MFKFTFDRFFKAKGIDKPFTFLVRAGFSENFATRVNQNRVQRIGLKELEKLCLALRCTPNDLIDWIPDQTINTDKEHPIHALRKSGKEIDLRGVLQSMTLDELEDIDVLIQEKLNSRQEKNE